MNYSTAVFLVNQHVRAVQCAYEVNAHGEPAGNLELFKTFDTTLKKGDLVVVPTKTRVKRTVVIVVETHVEVNLESDVQMDWIVSKVDPADYEATLAKEQQAIDTIKAAELRKKREELAKTLLANIDPDAAKMFELVDMSKGADSVAPETAPE